MLQVEFFSTSRLRLADFHDLRHTVPLFPLLSFQLPSLLLALFCLSFFFFFFLHTRHPLNHARGYKSGAFPGIQLIQQEISAKWSKRISRQREPFETNTSYPKVRVTCISRYPFGFAVKSSSPQKKHQPRWHPSTAHSMFLLSFCRRVAQLVVVQSSYLTRLNSV